MSTVSVAHRAHWWVLTLAKACVRTFVRYKRCFIASRACIAARESSLCYLIIHAFRCIYDHSLISNLLLRGARHHPVNYLLQVSIFYTLLRSFYADYIYIFLHFMCIFPYHVCLARCTGGLFIELSLARYAFDK